MKIEKTYWQNILFAVFLTALFIPMIVKSLNLINEKPLGGVIVRTDKPALSDSTWFDGSYQQQYEKYLNENIGLRKTFIRLNNQIDFSIFDKTSAEKVVIGKDNYLFENNYIDATTGKDFIGNDKAQSLIEKAKEVESILNDMSIKMLIAFTPGKATFYQEYIPEKYFSNNINPTTNHAVLTELCKKEQINYIDFNTWFLDIKDTSTYPLFPKAGIHWSYYGMYLCADSLIKKIETDISKDIPDLQVQNIEISSEQRDPEYDLGNLMNLLYPIKTYDLAYPQFSYNQENKYRPKVLVIGDSFYWNIYFSGIPANIFNSLDFWYYNSQCYNDGTNKSAYEIVSIDYLETIKQFEYIIILQTDGGLNNFGFGFFDKFLRSVNQGEIPAEIRAYMDQILKDQNWKSHVEQKASERGISFDEMLFLDAQYMYESEKQKEN